MPVRQAFAAIIICACLAGSAGRALAQDAHERRGAPAGAFDLYLLALSWSPGFCDIEGDRKGKPECMTGSRLGFVLHGLWAQFETGDYPTLLTDVDGASGRLMQGGPKQLSLLAEAG